jgi:hypothetical protein
MRLPSGEFVWGLGDNSKTNFTVRDFKAFARRMYKSYMGDLVDTNLFDQQLHDKILIMQGKLAVSGRFLRPYTPGVLDLETEYASGYKPRPAPQPSVVFFSINGAGSSWNMGYPFDIGETLDKSKCHHQPIGYNTSPVPMNKGVKDGYQKFLDELWMPRPYMGGLDCRSLWWNFNFYSMGALVGMGIVDRVLHGDLQMFKPTMLGGSTFGNPRRQMNHSFPGCGWSTGEGIATPTDHDLPDTIWDFACDKNMPGGGGDDLYTKMADDENEQTTKNMRAVWDIINKGNPLSLFGAVAMLMAHPNFQCGWDAGVAAFKALNFFVVKGTGPHVKYQFTQPIPNDPRDCWELARAHAADLVARAPREPLKLGATA